MPMGEKTKIFTCLH